MSTSQTKGSILEAFDSCHSDCFTGQPDVSIQSVASGPVVIWDIWPVSYCYFYPVNPYVPQCILVNGVSNLYDCDIICYIENLAFQDYYLEYLVYTKT